MRWLASTLPLLALLGGCGGTIGTGGLFEFDLAVPSFDAVADGPACDGTPRSCGPPGACMDCTGNQQGVACVMGACGCMTPEDCSGGRTCIGGLCSAPCSAFTPCQSGCCANGHCVPGNTGRACGTTGSMCVDCTGNVTGTSCVAGKCGCSQAADCPPRKSCNKAAGQCESACTGMQPCSSGCCTGMISGACVDGISDVECGSGTVCADCTKQGLECTGITCGCTRAADCPAGKACDVLSKKCVTACNPNQHCNGGCCRNGMCSAGTDNASCATDGGTCNPCPGGKPTCINGVCDARCGGVGDGQCGEGNCCSLGQCVAGNMAKTCGYSGMCGDCSNRSTGNRCLAPMGSKNWVCGCAAREDCPAANPAGGVGGYACDTNSSSCTNACNLPGVTLCNGGCCAMNQCRAGNGTATCGINGGFCNNCELSCSPGPACNLNTGTCGCTMARGQCNLNVICTMNGANRIGCNLGSNSCCVPGIYNYPDNGNPAGCCSGQSAGGKCSCFGDGTATGNPANPWACCSVEVDIMGRCKCLANGASADFGLGAVAVACCSNRVMGVTCICSPAGGTCQSNAGCCAPLTCQNGTCK